MSARYSVRSHSPLAFDTRSRIPLRMRVLQYGVAARVREGVVPGCDHRNHRGEGGGIVGETPVATHMCGAGVRPAGKGRRDMKRLIGNIVWCSGFGLGMASIVGVMLSLLYVLNGEFTLGRGLGLAGSFTLGSVMFVAGEWVMDIGADILHG